MKKVILILAALTVAFSAYSQVVDSTQIEISDEDKLDLLENEVEEYTEFEFKGFMKITTKGDTTNINFKNKKLVIIDTPGSEQVIMVDKNLGEKYVLYTEDDFESVMDEIEDTEMEEADKEMILESLEKEKARIEQELAIAEAEMERAELEKEKAEIEREIAEQEMEEAEKDMDDDESDWSDFDFSKKKDKKNKFEGHFASMEFGLNNFVNSDYSMNYDPDWLNLNTTKSWNFNLNMAQQSFNIIRNRVGFVTGVGLEWNGYNLDANTNIQKVDGQIAPDSTYFGLNLKKNKFTTTYITVPALLELQFSKDGDFYAMFGVIGGLKIGNSKKIVYYNNGKKEKQKERGDDLNLRSLRYGVMAKIGFDVVDIYARYYLNSLFENEQDPELYPFSIGFALNF